MSLSSIDKLKPLIKYFNKFPLLGIKGKDFKDWEIIYNMILSKEHLTDKGRSKIKLIQSNMNSQRSIPLSAGLLAKLAVLAATYLIK